jgi:hypothetical protein
MFLYIFFGQLKMFSLYKFLPSGTIISSFFHKTYCLLFTSVTTLLAHLAYTVGHQLNLCMLPSASVVAVMNFWFANGMDGLCFYELSDWSVNVHDPALSGNIWGQVG